MRVHVEPRPGGGYYVWTEAGYSRRCHIARTARDVRRIMRRVERAERWNKANEA